MKGRIVKGRAKIAGTPKSILVIQLGDIGDVILSLPCIRVVRENFPQARIVVAVHEKARGLLEDCSWVDAVVSVSKEQRGILGELFFQWRFFRRLRSYGFDLAVDLRTGTRGAVMAWLCGARQRIGFYAEDGELWRNRLFTILFAPAYNAEIHMIDYLLDLFRACGLKIIHSEPKLSIPVSKKKRAAEILAAAGVDIRKTIIAVQPFSLWSYKELPYETYVYIINKILESYDVSLILIGTEDERGRVQKISNSCKFEVTNLAGKTSIDELAAVISCCSLFIGIDSSGQHLAAAVGVRTVTIYGPTDPSSWAPRGKDHVIVRRNLECVPCHNKGCGNSGKSRCLVELSPEEIFEILGNQLGKICPV